MAQLVAFYKALLSHGPAWTAVLFLMQLFMGDRADCARQCTTSWLCLLSPKPYINIPEGVNGKTTARKVPIHCDYAKAVHFDGVTSAGSQGVLAVHWSETYGRR